MADTEPDRPFAEEVLINLDSNYRFHYQRLDPWVRNICRKKEAGTFDQQLLEGGVRRILVPAALDATKEETALENPRSVDGPTRALIAKGLAEQIAERADDARKDSGCKAYESDEAQAYRRELARYR